MLLTLDAITKSFPGPDGKVPVLRAVSLRLEAGQTLALTGESGSGKSTLLHIASGLETPDSGSVIVDGQTLTGRSDRDKALMRRSKIALIFQQFNLIPSLSVAANIRFQAALGGSVDDDHVTALSTRLGLAPYLNAYPETLSGGQQQRVAIARALAARPKLLLADEPTGNLDENTAEDVLNEMLSLVRDSGAAMMVVTHSAAVAARMDRILHLRGGTLT